MTVGLAVFLLRLDRPANQTLHHHRLESKLLDHKLEFVDSVLGRAHRDVGGWREPVFESVEKIRGHQVVGARCGETQFIVLDTGEEERERRIGDGEVEADLAHPLVEQPRQHRGGAVERVARGPATLSRYSSNAGSYSTQWPSESITG